MPAELGVGEKIDDLSLLRDAVERLGGVFLEGQTTYAWYQRHVGDYPMPAWMSKDQLGKCEHAAKFDGARYELGFVRHDGDWKVIYDFYDHGLSERIGGESASKLVDAYVKAYLQKKQETAYIAAAAAKMWPVSSERLPNSNAVKLTIRVPGG